MPETYIRKQTLTTGERYITQELKELESKILGAHERLITLEHRLFDELLESISAQLDRIQRTANAVAQLDVLTALPAGGSKVKSGRTVYLTVNADSAPKVAIPDIMDNSSLRQAEAKLRALGFKITEPEYISGEKDWVYSIKYRGRDLKAGEKIPHEAVLTLTVGNGNETMPEDSALVNESGTANDDKPVVDESWF